MVTLYKINDIISRSNAILLLRLNPLILERQQFVLIKEEFKSLPSKRLEDIELSGVKNNNIRCDANDAVVTFGNSKINLLDDFEFDTGAIHFDRDVPHFINGDPIRLKQVATNLISNAIKFTHRDGEVRMNVDYEKENNLLRFEVKDTGVGIAQENLEKIFKPFSQEDSTITRKFGGTGLGLTISYDLVKLMGSELKVISELGVGSSFYFLLPLNLNVKSENIGKKIIKGNIEKRLEAKILLVEDNEANQIFMKIILKKMGLMYDIANDGIEAVELFRSNKYNLVLMDENMPNMSGIEATSQILKYEKENNLLHTPIIALTANALIGDRERFLASGMDEYMTKPVNKQKLAIVLEKFLNDKKI